MIVMKESSDAKSEKKEGEELLGSKKKEKRDAESKDALPKEIKISTSARSSREVKDFKDKEASKDGSKEKTEKGDAGTPKVKRHDSSSSQRTESPNKR